VDGVDALIERIAGLNGVESMSPTKTTEELVHHPHMARFPQRWATGPVMGRFLRALRDEKKILANVCPRCGRSQLPPREVCAVCRVAVHDFQEVGPEGVLRNFDVVYYASPDPVTGQSREVPYASCYVELDGCEGGATLWHELRETDVSKIRRNARVRAVFEEDGKRTGATTDIKYFEIIGDENGAGAAPPPGTHGARTADGTDAFVVNGTFALPYNYFAGRVGSTWLVALRDEQKIYGVRHPRTGKVYVPPRQVDERDFTNLTGDWVEVGPEGTVTGFTIIRYPEPYQPLPVPYGLALVRLDGADTALAHIVREQDLGRLKSGTRVRAVFSQKRTASILDIAWFEPI
jgi:uncharacterized OB-fold protein